MAYDTSSDVPHFTSLLEDRNPGMAQFAEQLLRRAPHAVAAHVDAWCLDLASAAELLGTLAEGPLPPFLARAASKRRRSFIAGRLCAERALAGFANGQGVGRGTFGEPLWPIGTVGSITHNDQVAIAAAGRDDRDARIGIDSEIIVDASGYSAIERLCCTSAERHRWAGDDNRHLAVTLVFSAKEAYYKAIYPTVRRYVEFDEVEVTHIDWQRGELVIQPRANLPLAAEALPAIARFTIDAGMVHTSVSQRVTPSRSLARTGHND